MSSAPDLREPEPERICTVTVRRVDSLLTAAVNHLMDDTSCSDLYSKSMIFDWQTIKKKSFFSKLITGEFGINCWTPAELSSGHADIQRLNTSQLFALLSQICQSSRTNRNNARFHQDHVYFRDLVESHMCEKVFNDILAKQKASQEPCFQYDENGTSPTLANTGDILLSRTSPVDDTSKIPYADAKNAGRMLLQLLGVALTAAAECAEFSQIFAGSWWRLEIPRHVDKHPGNSNAGGACKRGSSSQMEESNKEEGVMDFFARIPSMAISFTRPANQFIFMYHSSDELSQCKLDIVKYGKNATDFVYLTQQSKFNFCIEELRSVLARGRTSSHRHTASAALFGRVDTTNSCGSRTPPTKYADKSKILRPNEGAEATTGDRRCSSHHLKYLTTIRHGDPSNESLQLSPDTVSPLAGTSESTGGDMKAKAFPTSLVYFKHTPTDLAQQSTCTSSAGSSDYSSSAAELCKTLSLARANLRKARPVIKADNLYKCNIQVEWKTLLKPKQALT